MISRKVYDFFAQLVFNKTGMYYPEKDYYRLDSRINTLKSHFECQSYDELLALYQQRMTPNMETVLIDLCTNNETYFFRDNNPFDGLREVCAEIWSKNPLEQIKIWSCASSTGQEPLSILMTLKENFPNMSPSSVALIATDISSEALKKCKSGRYSSLEVQRGLPINMLMKYFDKNSDDSWTAKAELMNMVHYEYFNLLDGHFPVSQYHIIFCRNVLIYQNIENKQKIMEKLYHSLKSDGHLVMGAGESLIGSNVQLKHESVGSSMFFKKSEDFSKAA